jgi:hypothetical protein
MIYYDSLPFMHGTYMKKKKEKTTQAVKATPHIN